MHTPSQSVRVAEGITARHKFFINDISLGRVWRKLPIRQHTSACSRSSVAEVLRRYRHELCLQLGISVSNHKQLMFVCLSNLIVLLWRGDADQRD